MHTSHKGNQCPSTFSRGFTIVELLIVIVVIGILAAITIVAYTGISQKAVASSLQSDLASASKKLKLYQIDNMAYPTALDCAATPAANTICLKASPGNTYSYSVVNNTNPQTFSLRGTNTNTTAYVVTDDASPVVYVPPAPVNLTFNNTSTGPSGTIQTWTVPVTNTYTIEAWGAQAGQSTSYSGLAGLGARIKGDVLLAAGTVLKILVGQMSPNNTYDTGGGGGTFVTTNSNSPIMIAGGGGGASANSNSLSAGSVSMSGNSNANGTAGGSAGGGGGACTTAGGGGGLTGNGSGSWFGYSFISGGAGYNAQSTGGFGGGGAGGGTNGSGGGGGYSGGAGSCWSSVGGGGGSYNAGTNQSNTAGARTGQGLVTIHN